MRDVKVSSGVPEMRPALPSSRCQERNSFVRASHNGDHQKEKNWNTNNPPISLSLSDRPSSQRGSLSGARNIWIATTIDGKGGEEGREGEDYLFRWPLVNPCVNCGVKEIELKNYWPSISSPPPPLLFTMVPLVSKWHPLFKVRDLH